MKGLVSNFITRSEKGNASFSGRVSHKNGTVAVIPGTEPIATEHETKAN
jgi:hypothetical protein